MAVYLPVIWFDFTNYDDPSYVTENPPVANGLTWTGIQWAFTHSHSANWHPLTWLSHMVDCQVYGLKAGGHHLTNLLFHGCNTLLIFGLLRFMTGAFWRSALVAALFAIHPLHVESVAWISERKDVLSTFFGLLSMWAYVGYAKACKEVSPLMVSNAPSAAPRRPLMVRAAGFYVSSLFLLACGLMSKAMLVTWPFVFLLLDFWPLRRLPIEKARGVSSKALFRLILEKAPFFAVAAVTSLITMHTQKSASAMASLVEVPFATRVLNAVVSLFVYGRKLIWPDRLSVIYLDAGTPQITALLPAALALLIITFLAVWVCRTRPYVLFGWLFFLGTLVPVIGLVKVGTQSMADRYTYIPSIGFFVMVVWFLGLLRLHGGGLLLPLQGEQRKDPDTGENGLGSLEAAPAGIALVLIAVGGLVGLILVAQKQVLVWQNTETLFRHALAVKEQNFVAYNSLGFYYADFGEIKEAKRMFQAALAANPSSAAAWNKLGSLVMNEGNYEQAIENCKKALQINPRMPEAYTTLGLTYIKQSKTNDALLAYSNAISFRPDYAPAHYNMANVLAHQGRFDLAAEHYKSSLASDPRSADGHNNLAFILARQQQFDEAISHFRMAVLLKPGFWQAHYGLAELFLRKNQLREAAAEYSEVLRAKPDFALAHFQLAVTLARQGSITPAVGSAKNAQRLATQNGQQELARKSQELIERLSSR